MNSSERILVALPTYNNANTLAEVVTSVLARTRDVVVIDDGSTDATAEVLKGFPQVTALRHPVNRGKGEALLTAFRYARLQGFSSVISMDTDGQHFAEDLPGMMAAARANPKALVIGDRQLAAHGDVPTSSRFGARFSDFWVRVETGKTVRDTQSGFRVWPLAFVDEDELSCARYDFEIEALVKALWRGAEPASHPIRVSYSPPTGRVSHFHPWRDNVRLSRLHTRLVILRMLRALGLGKQRVGRGGASLVPLCLSVLGLRFCYLLLHVVVFFYFVTGWRHVKTIMGFYDRLEGRRGLVARLWGSFRNHVHFAASLVDRAAVDMRRHEPKFRRDAPASIFERQGRFILVGAHLGDWTLCSSAFSGERKGKVSILVDLSRTREFEAQLHLMRAAGLGIIDVSNPGLGVMLEMKRAIDDEGILCFLGDRVQPGTRMQSEPFLGAPASFPVVAYEIALRLGCPVYAFFCTRENLAPDLHFDLRIREIWDGRSPSAPDELLKSYVRCLEENVRRVPQNWYNFFDFWKNDEKP